MSVGATGKRANPSALPFYSAEQKAEVEAVIMICCKRDRDDSERMIVSGFAVETLALRESSKSWDRIGDRLYKLAEEFDLVHRYLYGPERNSVTLKDRITNNLGNHIHNTHGG